MIGLGLGITSGRSSVPNFLRAGRSQAFIAALNEAAATGLALDFQTPQYWLRGARQGNFASGVSGATYTRTGSRAGLDAAVIYPANVPRIADGSGLRVHGAGTNQARNSTASGGTVGVIGSGGVLPTNWSRISAGLTTEIVSITGDAVRIRFSGTPSGGYVEIAYASAGYAPASPGQIWTGSRYARLVAGTLPAAASGGFFTVVQQWTGVPSYVTETAQLIAFNGANFVRGVVTTPGLNGATTQISNVFQILVNNGVPCDFTVEIASPQLEQSSFASDYIPNPNTGASSSAGVDDVLVNLTTAGIDVNRPMTLIYQYVNSGNQALNSAEAALFQDSAPSTNRISSRSQPANQVLYTRSGTGAAPSFNAPTPTVGSLVTAAISVSAGQIAIARTGNASVSSLAVGGSPLAIDRLGIGKTEGSALYSNTGIQAVALIPRALSDAELLALVA